jgi:hypothetical protein
MPQREASTPPSIARVMCGISLWMLCGEGCGHPTPSSLPCHPPPSRPPPETARWPEWDASRGGTRRALRPPPRGPGAGGSPARLDAAAHLPSTPPPKPDAPGDAPGASPCRRKRVRTDRASSEASSLASRPASGASFAATPRTSSQPTAAPAVCAIRSDILAPGLYA